MVFLITLHKLLNVDVFKMILNYLGILILNGNSNQIHIFNFYDQC